MADHEQFLKENREALLEEMADSIGKMNSIIDSVLHAPISAELDGSLMRTYFAANAVQVGNLTTLFNQYYVLLKGAIPKKNRPVGFASLIKGAGIKVAGPGVSVLTEDEADE